MNAVQAKRAIHVASLQWLEQSQFTTALDDLETPRSVMPSADAVLSMTFMADLLIAGLHFQRGDG
jgi:hypothetical protein